MIKGKYITIRLSWTRKRATWLGVMSKMDNEIIKDIHAMLQGGLEAGEKVDLASLLWTIDAKHRLIPEASEINEALAMLSKYRILRERDGVSISGSDFESKEEIELEDITKAMKKYESTINEIS